MKCNRHPSEQGPGVCAPCLHERLLAAQNLSPIHDGSDPEPLPPLPHSHRPRFFSNHQSGPAAGGGGVRFSLLSYLFGHHRSEEKETDSVASEDLKSTWWFRPLIRLRERRKRSQMFTAAAEAEAKEEATGRATAPCVVSNRGMSPAADESDNGSESGYSTASSGACRMPSPGRRAGAGAGAGAGEGAMPHRRRRRRRGRGVSGLGVWLSPLVRANPGGQRGQAAEAGFSGDLRGGSNPIQHHYQPPHHRRAPGGAASLGLNRSRKLVDLGRR